jgi:adenine phosphoribosyltransferase
MGRLLRESLENARVVKFGDYEYFVHPLTDGVPEIHPHLLEEVVDDVLAIADVDVDRIVTAEAMGIPIGTALSLRTGVPFTILRKRRYGLDGETEIGQSTGYSKGALYVNGVKPGDRVLLVDDVVSTGGTLGPVLDAFRDMNVTVKDVVVLVEKGTGRGDVEKRHGIPIHTLAAIDIKDGRVIVRERGDVHAAERVLNE